MTIQHDDNVDVDNEDDNRNKLKINEIINVGAITILLIICIRGLQNSIEHIDDGCKQTNCTYRPQMSMEGFPYCIVLAENKTCITTLDVSCPTNGTEECFYVPDQPQPGSRQFKTNRCFSTTCYNTEYQLSVVVYSLCGYIMLMTWIFVVIKCLVKKKVK